MTTVHCQRILTFAVPVVAGAMLLGACGGEKQMTAEAPSAPPVEAVGQTNMQNTTQIPNTPTASNISISTEVLQACNIPDKDAYFAFDSSHLTGFDQAPLDAVATCFTSGPMVGRRLDLIGHADPRGANGYNMTLGQSRADAVSGYLSAHGVKSSNLSATSRGALDATGHDETGWAHDRRVDIMLTK